MAEPLDYTTLSCPRHPDETALSRVSRQLEVYGLKEVNPPSGEGSVELVCSGDAIDQQVLDILDEAMVCTRFDCDWKAEVPNDREVEFM